MKLLTCFLVIISTFTFNYKNFIFMLSIGDKAPDFKGLGEDGQIINLEQFKGKKLVLYFYPKDNTPGCTAEACNIRDHYNLSLEKG